MSINLCFGRALHRVRTGRGMTQEDFSVVSSRTYISSLERGMKSPTLEKIDQIAQNMGVHPLTLIALAYAENDEVQAEALLAETRNELGKMSAPRAHPANPSRNDSKRKMRRR